VALIFVDIDGTLTEVSSPWQDIHEIYNLWDTKGIPILENWLNGNITYDDFCHQDVDLWNEINLSIEEIHSRFDSYKIRSSSASFLRELVDNGHSVTLLSSGFTYIGNRLLACTSLYGKVSVIANHLFNDEAGKLKVTVSVSGDLSSSRSKAGHVARICHELGVSPAKTIAIGDGPSDQHMFDACGKSYLIEEDIDLLNAAHEICKKT
jgi:HAD superfamily phosphoserine phosphatase-like hydrolase